MSGAFDPAALDVDLDALTSGDGVADVDLDLGAFDTIGAAATSANRYVLPKPPRKARPHLVRYDRAAEMARELCPAIAAGETVHALLSGNFIFGDFLEALAVENMVRLEDLTLSTLSISDDNVLSFANMMETGFLGTLNVVVSDYWWSHNRHNARFIYETLDRDDRFQLAVAGLHTKIALLLTAKGSKIVVHGSANLRSSRCLEAVTIETSPELYDFHREWHDRILEEYATVRKSLRGERLFDHLVKPKE